MHATPLQDLLDQLASEGDKESSGFFTLSAASVGERYRKLLAQEPSLPWLRWLQLAYSLRAGRMAAQLGRNQHRLQLVGVPHEQDLAEALRGYPEPPRGVANLLHEVLWLFLAQQPEQVRVSAGGVLLRIWADRFERVPDPSPRESEVVVEVDLAGGVWQVATAPLQRARVHSSLTRRALYHPGSPEGLNWDGGFRIGRTPTGAAAQLVMMTLVSRERSRVVEHFSAPEPAHFRPQALVLNGQRLLELPGDSAACPLLALEGAPDSTSIQAERGFAVQQLAGCDLRLEGSQAYRLGERCARLRLLLFATGERATSRLTPVMDGVALDPVPLVDWPQGLEIVAACPDDLKTDFSGLILVRDEVLAGWLDHLKQRYARQIQELALTFPSRRQLTTLGDLFIAHTH